MSGFSGIGFLKHDGLLRGINAISVWHIYETTDNWKDGIPVAVECGRTPGFVKSVI